MSLDDLLWLQGDEDADVSVHCRGCDKRGEPVIFYSTHGSNPYGLHVPLVRTIASLDEQMRLHVTGVHGGQL